MYPQRVKFLCQFNLGQVPQSHTHPSRQQLGFHYHDAEEWLEVVRGHCGTVDAPHPS
jgi:hypothetical protein